MRLNLKPKKAENLKVIDHIGTLYATFNGTSIWRMDRVAFGILRLCNGKRTVDQIIKEVAKKAGLEPKHVKKIVLEILEDLRKKKFIRVK
jgi:hypothetical protein